MVAPASDGIGGVGRTLAVTLGLLVLLLALVSLGRGALSARAIPAEGALDDWIEPGPLPFGLRPDTALRRGGEVLVSYTDPEAPEEAPRLEAPKKKPRGKQMPEPFDWSKLAIGPAGTPPIELLAVRYGKDAGKRIEQLFEAPGAGGDGGGGRDRRGGGDEPGEIETFDAGGGRALMDRGRLRWFDYEVLYVQWRELERGGTFRDVIQVNLSLPGRPLVLYARWPRGLPASRDRVLELLEALPPRATEN